MFLKTTESLEDRRCLNFPEAQKLKLKVNWTTFEPVRPAFLGTKTFADYDLSILFPYVDLKPFFDFRQLRGKYPNRRFPKLFNDKIVGEEAKPVLNDTQAILKNVNTDQSLKASGIIGSLWWFLCCSK
jgi:5-methyltetrahydrofolate--homocysteine methyltransferase